MYIYICVYICIYIYIYIHTYICIYVYGESVEQFEAAASQSTVPVPPFTQAKYENGRTSLDLKRD